MSCDHELANEWPRCSGKVCQRETNLTNLGRVRLGSIRNKNNWNNASKRLFGSFSHSGIPGFSFRLLCSQEQNSRNIFLFRNIPNERALRVSRDSCKIQIHVILGVVHGLSVVVTLDSLKRTVKILSIFGSRALLVLVARQQLESTLTKSCITQTA